MMGVQLDVSVVSWDYTSSSGALTFHHTTLAACVAPESVSDPGQIGIPAPSFGSRAPQAETAAITLEGCGSPEFQCKISRASGVQISLVKFTHKGEGIIYHAPESGPGRSPKSPVDESLAMSFEGWGLVASRGGTG